MPSFRGRKDKPAGGQGLRGNVDDDTGETGDAKMTKAHRRRLGIVVILFLLGLSVDADQAASLESKSFLWKVRSTTSTVYLLGSVHLFKKEMYPLDRKIEEAFDRSDRVVVEANLNALDVKMDLQKLLEKAVYLDEDTLERHVSKETYELIRRKGEELGLPLELISRQKPWFLALMFSSVGLLKFGFDANYGIDLYFLRKAAGKKTILELESLDYQIDLLSGFNERDQELFLLMTLRDLDTLGQDVDRLLQAWAAGDAAGLEKLMTRSITGDRRFSPIYDALITNRNKTMALKIEDFLKTGEVYFVIVGAGHLTGDNGIVESLRKKGYLVEQM